MKKFLLSFLFFISAIEMKISFGQVGIWTWINGDTIPGSLGYYGVQGVADLLNQPQGVYEGCEWTDNNGKFWLFGGENYYGYYNDLWKYDPTTNLWTWMKGPGMPNDTGSYGTIGVPSNTNIPPARGYAMASWTDHNGYLWLYGGNSYLNQDYWFNDLWKYDITTNQWIWVSGSIPSNQPPTYGVKGIPSTLNSPGGRNEVVATWVDGQNNLWLFGGAALNTGYAYNDLWSYNIATNEWTWMNGSDSVKSPGVFGTQGIPDELNTPSGRASYSRWNDDNGNLWLFGGWQVQGGYFRNDLWKYSIATNEWTWMKGSDTLSDLGFYGTKGIATSTNNPTCRGENRSCWKDNEGNFWMYGGWYYTQSNLQNQLLNDLWKYNPITNMWTWMDGDSTANHHAVWGILNVPDSTNKPDSRMGSNAWYDSTHCSAYIFGGAEYWNSNGIYMRNDLWRYALDPNCLAVGISPTSIAQDLIQIFPDPSSDFITFDLPNFSNEKLSITIYNPNGQQVNHHSNLHSSRIKIPVSQLGADGLYFYTLKLSDEKIFSGKFLIQR